MENIIIPPPKDELIFIAEIIPFEKEEKGVLDIIQEWQLDPLFA